MYYYLNKLNKFRFAVATLLLLSIMGPTAPIYAEESVNDQTTVITGDLLEENFVDPLPPRLEEDSNNDKEEVQKAEEESEVQDEVQDTEESEPSGEGGDIESGDAAAATQIETYANTNVTDVDNNLSEGEENEEDLTNEDLTKEEVTETKNSDTDKADQELLPPTSLPVPEINIENNNEAHVSSTVTVAASTGDNNANGSEGSVTTGDAIAYADVLNVVNTNIVNSDGLVTFINDVLGYEDFNLTDTFETTFSDTTANSTDPCNLATCEEGGANLIVTNENNADIHNNISVTADTGGNTVGSDGSITTGDAYASANLVNVANTNIVDSNYLLLVFNNYDSYNGNIILPNSNFFNQLLNANGTSYPNTTINNTNEADLQNLVSVNAKTGNNTTSSGDIDSGDAYTSSIVNNQINTNLIGGTTFNLLIKVHGDWSGDIFGLPDGIEWRETPAGIQFYNTNSYTNGATSPLRELAVSNTNQANIHNDVQVFALTGDNQAGEGGEIKTGDAMADSNILNLVNTNVVGQNWANLIFNIYGNWSGNLSFGQPNLWIGAKAESDHDPIMPNHDVSYTFTVFNAGTSNAPNVTLTNIYKNNELTLYGADSETVSGTAVTDVWQLGDIGPGETREFTVDALTSSSLPNKGPTDVMLHAHVQSDLEDADESDNDEFITIEVGKKDQPSNSTRKTFAGKIEIKKTASQDYASPGDTVNYTVNIYNRGGQIYEAKLIDLLKNEAGDVIHGETINLDTIKNGETINFDYSVEFSSDTATGTYTNTAQVMGWHQSRSKKYQILYQSPLASHDLIIGDGPTGQVLGASTFRCEAYLTDFMRYGQTNNPEQVKKLKLFLNDYQGANLSVDGNFDLMTEVAVRDFQLRHADEILEPWGLQHDSGFVYLTTRKKINEIYCAGTRHFPLAQSELKEISSYRMMLAKAENGIPLKPEEDSLGTAVELTKEAIVKTPEEETEEVTTHPPAPNDKTNDFVSEKRDHFLNKLMERVTSWFNNVAEATHF